MQEVRTADNGEDERMEAEVLEKVNVWDMADDLAEEERLLGEGNADKWGIAEGIISWA